MGPLAAKEKNHKEQDEQHAAEDGNGESFHDKAHEVAM